MKICINCGKTVEGDNYRNCIYCGGNLIDEKTLENRDVICNNKKASYKGLLTAVICLAVMVIGVSCFLLGQFSINNSTNNSTNNSAPTVAVETEAERPSLPSDFDVEAKVLEIRALYNLTESGTNIVSVTNAASGAKAYSTSSDIIKISVPADNEINYDRHYYFDGGKLYFAFLCNGTRENRFYFYNDILFRWIDESKVIHDKEFENQIFTDWEETVLEDSKRVKTYFD